ncbi:hypothetical protein F5Y18DRAFT_177067 [Xylariaceae sp. FL1019]|nr:hypothetical protein F5Y18DRAFT_177067 [Xylariaceae sp. FL1019]
MVSTALGRPDWDLVKSCIILVMASQAYHPPSIMAHLLNESHFTFGGLVLLKHGLRASPPDLTDQFGDRIMCYKVFWPEYSWKMLYEAPDHPRLRGAAAGATVHSGPEGNILSTSGLRGNATVLPSKEKYRSSYESRVQLCGLWRKLPSLHLSPAVKMFGRRQTQRQSRRKKPFQTSLSLHH